eukprot:Clim_evm70s152 gene=Clim_evmTU70s152
MSAAKIVQGIKVTNTFSRLVANVKQFAPTWAQSPLLSAAFNYQVKLAGTCSLKIDYIDNNRVQTKMENHRKNQNHLGFVHAVAIILAAESATGMIVGINVPDTSVPVLKSTSAHFVKRPATGAVLANAQLTDEQVNQIQTTEKGEVNVACTITDADNKNPIDIEMIWAWVPKVRKPKSDV